jgi:hypothetical protein
VKRFDIVLVLSYFRSATAYLSVIRHLSSTTRIGVLLASDDASLQDKTGEAQSLFMQLCVESGAEVIASGTTATATLLIVQQFPYSDRSAIEVSSRIRARRRIGLMALALAGLEPHDRFLAQFEIRKAYVPNVRFTRFLLDRRGAARRYSAIELEQVGLPYGTHPVFPEFRADWLIAAPTLFSFSSEAGKQAFLETVLMLLSQIPPTDVVAYKSHNGNQLDYFAPRLHYALASTFTALPGGEKVLRMLAARGPLLVRRHVSRTLTSALHQKVLRRAVPMTELTPYGAISLEAFLPGVGKGVIGGLSNTIWGTLYFQLPFFNCVDPASVHHGASELLNKSSEALLKLNLEFFGVPYCHGDLSRGSRGDTIVGNTDRSGNLLAAIQRDLTDAS